MPTARRPTDKASSHEARSEPLLLRKVCPCGGGCAECAAERQRDESEFAFPVRAKLRIGAIDDPLEQEADRVGDQVMATPAVLDISSAPPRIQHFSSPSSGQTVAAPPSVDRALANPGTTLEPSLRQDMEQRFGRDFSQVRVHADAQAGASARAVGARAYTVGRDIVFADRQSSADRALLAHELAHTVQQSGLASLATLQRVPIIDPASAAPTREPLEVIAQRIAKLAFGPQQDFGDFPTGPVLSVVRDDQSGEIFVALNTGIKDKVSEIIEQRLLARIDAISKGQVEVIHDIVPGGHAEVVAVNKAILAREGATQRTVTSEDMPTFELHNVWLKESRRFETAARCEHCDELTKGVRVTELLDIAENPVSATSPRARTVVGNITTDEPGPGGKPPAEFEGHVGEPVTHQETAAQTTSAGGELSEAKTELQAKSNVDEPPITGVGEGIGPEFVPKAFRFGADIGEGVITGIISDYFTSKIFHYFQHRQLKKDLEALQPEIEYEKTQAVEQKSTRIAAGNSNTLPFWAGPQFYWVITIRLRTFSTTAVGGGHSVAMSSTRPELVSVTISQRRTSKSGRIEQGKPIVAPGLHAAILQQDAQTVIYSQPIMSWGAVIPPDLEKRVALERSHHAEHIDKLRFSNTGKEVTSDSLLAWARLKYPRLLADPRLLQQIYTSQEFSGSQDARERAAMALVIKLREEELWSSF